MQVSAYSLASLTMAAKPRMTSGASVVGLDFDASVAWPTYDWMGVAKAALESTARYLARDLGPEGIRVNLVAAGRFAPMAAKSIPASTSSRRCGRSVHRWWGPHRPGPAARACRPALLSPWFAATTGEIRARRRRSALTRGPMPRPHASGNNYVRIARSGSRVWCRDSSSESRLRVRSHHARDPHEKQHRVKYGAVTDVSATLAPLAWR